MREVTLFWRHSRVKQTAIAPMLDIVKRAEFLSYMRRTPRDVRIVLKIKFQPGKSPEDLNSLFFLELIETLHKPDDETDDWLLNVRLSHPLSNLNARTGATTAVSGSRLDGEGITYIIQGPAIRLRIVTAVARRMMKPDRISAIPVISKQIVERGPLNPKQLKLAKHAHDKGWFSHPKKIKISELADEVGLARATVSEHLARIESIVMRDFLGSYSEITVSEEDIASLVEMMEEDASAQDYSEDVLFRKLIADIVNAED